MEADFFRHKVQMWLLLRHVQRARCGAPGPPVPPLAAPAREAQVGAVLQNFERRVLCAPSPPFPLPRLPNPHAPPRSGHAAAPPADARC